MFARRLDSANGYVVASKVVDMTRTSSRRSLWMMDGCPQSSVKRQIRELGDNVSGEGANAAAQVHMLQGTGCLAITCCVTKLSIHRFLVLVSWFCYGLSYVPLMQFHFSSFDLFFLQSFALLIFL